MPNAFCSGHSHTHTQAIEWKVIEHESAADDDEKKNENMKKSYNL